MICKFCGNQKIALKFKLKNARVFVCDNCDFHFTSYLDPEISENNIIDDKPISEHLKIYLANQLQFNKLKFENQVKIVKRYLSGSLHSKILDVGCGGGLFLSSLKNERIECYGIEPEIERLKYSRQETIQRCIKCNVGRRCAIESFWFVWKLLQSAR